MLIGTCQLAALVFDLFEQARVVDSNRRLRGECFEERNDLGRECARTSTTDGQGANHLTLVKERHAEDGAHARTTQNVDHGRWLGTVDVSDLHGFASLPALPNPWITEPNGLRTHARDMLLAHIVTCCEMKFAGGFVELVDGAAGGISHDASMLENGGAAPCPAQVRRSRLGSRLPAT